MNRGATPQPYSSTSYGEHLTDTIVTMLIPIQSYYQVLLQREDALCGLLEGCRRYWHQVASCNRQRWELDGKRA